MTVAQLALNQTNGKWQVTFGGKLITESTAKYYLTQKIKSGALREQGIHSYVEVAQSSMSIVNSVIGNEGTDLTPFVEKFSVAERFDMIRDVTAAVGRKEITSAILTGEGGLGKSHTMLEGMEQAGLVDVNTLELSGPVDDNGEEEEEDGEGVSKVWVPENAFVQIKGNMTARVLYETLYMYNNRTIVFDDCDKVLTDSTAEMIFKGALDSNKDRWITWGSRVRSDIPRTFNFQGSVIFVTNRRSCDLDQALLSRSNAIDISMTRPQKIERMKFIGMRDVFMPEVNKTIVRECMQLVEQLQESITELNMRTLIKCVGLRRSVPNWQRTFEFSACR